MTNYSTTARRQTLGITMNYLQKKGRSSACIRPEVCSMCRRLERNQPGALDYPTVSCKLCWWACVAEALGTACSTGAGGICLLVAALCKLIVLPWRALSSGVGRLVSCGRCGWRCRWRLVLASTKSTREFGRPLATATVAVLSTRCCDRGA